MSITILQLQYVRPYTGQCVVFCNIRKSQDNDNKIIFFTKHKSVCGSVQILSFLRL